MGSYSLIVWRVRRQNKKAAIACLSKRLKKTRAMSCAVGAVVHPPGCKERALSLAVGVDSAVQSEEDEYEAAEGGEASRRRRLRWRRTSLPLHQKRIRSATGGVSIEMTNMAKVKVKGRPQLIKQAALCLDEDSSTRGDGQDTPVLQRPSGRFLAPPPPTSAAAAVAAHWLRNNEESSVSSINTAEKPTQLTNAFNSFEDEEAAAAVKNEYGDDGGGGGGTGAGILMAQLAAPVIALSLPPAEELPSRCQTPSPSRRPPRHRPSSPAHFLMRRCQSATTGDGPECSLESALTRGAPPSSVTPRLLHGHSLLSALRASQRAFSLRDRDGGKAAAREMRKRRSEVNIARKSGYIVLAFLALWLPLPISVSVCGHLTRSESDLRHLDACMKVQLIAHLFGLVTAVTNPIIYALAIRSFRVAFRKLTRRKWNDIRNWLGIGACLTN